MIVGVLGSPDDPTVGFLGLGGAGPLQLGAFECISLSGAGRYPPQLPADNERSHSAYADRHKKHQEHTSDVYQVPLMKTKASLVARSSYLHSPIR